MSDKPNILPNDGGFAFPGFWLEGSPSGNWTWKSINQGMSLRDYFAAAALQGLCAEYGTMAVNGTGKPQTVDMAHAAYAYADAMIAARQPKP